MNNMRKLIDLMTVSNQTSVYLIEDEFVTEMGNLIADFTEIPGNITLWTRPQPEALPHDKYRVKVFKNRTHVLTLSIGHNPKTMEEFPKLGKLASDELKETKKFISEYSSLLIEYVDAKLTLDELKMSIQHARQNPESLD